MSVAAVGRAAVRWLGVDGASVLEALRFSIEAARLGALRGFYFAGGDVASRIEWALDLMRAVKKQFDPKSTLNPGRFVGGI